MHRYLTVVALQSVLCGQLCLQLAQCLKRCAQWDSPFGTGGDVDTCNFLGSKENDHESNNQIRQSAIHQHGGFHFVLGVSSQKIGTLKQVVESFYGCNCSFGNTLK